LHADDFGMNRAVSDGIVRGFERGVLTSTALLANAPHATEAVRAWKRLDARRAAGALPSARVRESLDDWRSPFDLGVHLNLTQGRPLSGQKYPAELLDGQGRFPGILALASRLRRRRADFEAAIRTELVAQVAFLLDRGLPPTHLNGHQYIEMLPAVAGLLPELMEYFGIRNVRVAVEPALFATTLWHDRRPAAWLLALVKQHFARRLRASLSGGRPVFPRAYFGTAHAGRIDESLMRIFLRRTPDRGSVEIGLHPAILANDTAEGNEDGWLDPLAALRPKELALLESPRLAELLTARRLKLGRLSRQIDYTGHREEWNGPGRPAATEAARQSVI
jgi:chitin disaccharide deacetylase